MEKIKISITFMVASYNILDKEYGFERIILIIPSMAIIQLFNYDQEA